MFDMIAFDADDTLWPSEPLYQDTSKQLKDLLSRYVSREEVEQELNTGERRNLSIYGYGIKGFTLSMIETAIGLSKGKITGNEVLKIIGFAKEMLSLEVTLFDHVENTIHELVTSYPLMIITKGDLLDQERKLSKSGISDCFRFIEIVSEKNESTYKRVLEKYDVDPKRFLMVGNSLKSDIMPVIAMGGFAVHIPSEVNWVLDEIKISEDQSDRHFELENLGLLPALIERLVDE
jgi:putative hydrolase of the HAD superfamily